jgi:pimeloyl-ACP methyl ester carboxylesterase
VLRQRISLPIAFHDLAGPFEMAGWLSAPPSAPDTLLILVHGGFYTHAYWDFPHRPEVYSCVAWAYERGLAVLNIDRLGAGESSIPPGRVLDLPRQAEALRQVVGQAREGLEGRKFSRIVLVGHSLGSFISGLMQARFGGADGVVLTGVMGMNVTRLVDTPDAGEAFRRRSVRLEDDPVLAPQAARFDTDYLTIPATRRLSAFYRSPPADPATVEMDETLKGAMSVAENATMGMAADACEQLTVPVLVQVGLYDAMYFNPARNPDLRKAMARAREQAPANFTFDEPAPDAGHNLSLHPNARLSYDRMADWLAAQGLI